MLKNILQRAARSVGINLCGTDHLGVHLELDLARLTAHEPLTTIFDVGGNFGQTAVRFASAFPQAKVFTFEPVPTSFARLQRAVESHPNIRAFPTALGNERGTVKLNLTDSAGTNTIRHNPTATDSIEVAIDTLDVVAAANSVAGIDLLKIDVEGYEIPVLHGASGLLGNEQVRFVFAECMFSPDPEMPNTNFFDLHSHLERHGFCFVAYYAEAFELRRGSALGNVLYALRSKLPPTAPGGRARNIV